MDSEQGCDMMGSAIEKDHPDDCGWGKVGENWQRELQTLAGRAGLKDCR